MGAGLVRAVSRRPHTPMRVARSAVAMASVA